MMMSCNGCEKRKALIHELMHSRGDVNKIKNAVNEILQSFKTDAKQFISQEKESQ